MSRYMRYGCDTLLRLRHQIIQLDRSKQGKHPATIHESIIQTKVADDFEMLKTNVHQSWGKVHAFIDSVTVATKSTIYIIAGFKMQHV